MLSISIVMLNCDASDSIVEMAKGAMVVRVSKANPIWWQLHPYGWLGTVIGTEGDTRDKDKGQGQGRRQGRSNEWWSLLGWCAYYIYVLCGGMAVAKSRRDYQTWNRIGYGVYSSYSNHILGSNIEAIRFDRTRIEGLFDSTLSDPTFIRSDIHPIRHLFDSTLFDSTRFCLSDSTRTRFDLGFDSK